MPFRGRLFNRYSDDGRSGHSPGDGVEALLDYVAGNWARGKLGGNWGGDWDSLN